VVTRGGNARFLDMEQSTNVRLEDWKGGQAKHNAMQTKQRG